MSIKLTKKQLQVYNFISGFIKEHDYSPSYRDIQAGLGLSSVSSVAEHIDNLINLGVLRKSPGAARSLEVVDINHSETVELFKHRMLTATVEELETLKKAASILGINLE